jgi:phenylalanyl-tRNA synthetase beta chain
MLISLNWLKDYIELPFDKDVHDIANDLTMRTAEVESIKQTDAFYSEVKIVQIISIKPHPDASKLNLVTFDTGKGMKEVVCGAPNVAVGKKVPFAPVGTTLPGGFKLEAKEIRGILSEGMLCSAKELGRGDDQSGLLICADDISVGTTMGELWAVTSDSIIEIDNKSLTHRPDLWGHYGFARELSAIYSVTKKNVEDFIVTLPKNLPAVSVSVDPLSGCEAFSLIRLTGVSAVPSPQWIQSRLMLIGIKPINVLVDLTNYVMADLGIPMHAYDAAKVSGAFKVRLAAESESAVLLGNQKVLLNANDCLISDDKNPLALAGIMGTEFSSISETTTEIYLECAVWDASKTRLTSTRFGIRSESSARFEKSLDANLVQLSLGRYLYLLKSIFPTSAATHHMTWLKKPLCQFPISINHSVPELNNRLGTSLPPDQVKSILEYLDFKVDSLEPLVVHVPSFRATKDVSIAQDLNEEIGRMIGYDNIIPISPQTSVVPVSLSSQKQLSRHIENFLVHRACAFQVMTYPLIGKKLYSEMSFKFPSDELTLVNSLTQDAETMRSSLIPSFLDVIKENSKHRATFNLFELGRTYHYQSKNSSYNEYEELIVGHVDSQMPPFSQLYDYALSLLDSLKVPYKAQYDITFEPKSFYTDIAQWEGYIPGKIVNISVMGKTIGHIFTVHPLLLNQLKIKQFVCLIVLNLSSFSDQYLNAQSKSSYFPVELLPQPQFDFCLEMSSTQRVENVINILKARIPSLTKITVVDDFLSKDMFRFVTFSTIHKVSSTDFREKILSVLKENNFLLKN